MMRAVKIFLFLSLSMLVAVAVLRVSHGGLSTTTTAAVAEQPVAALPEPAVPMSAKERVPHRPPQPGETRSLSIRELGNFEYDTGASASASVPDDVRRLDGMKIRLRGFMLPLEQSEHVSQFALVPSLFSCCFGNPPGVQHTIIVACKPSTATEITRGQVVVEGTLHVREQRDGDYVVSLFQITNAVTKVVR